MIVKVPHNFKVSSLEAPASKSYAQRALFAATLAENPSLLVNLGNSNDVLHIQNIVQQLGAEIEPVSNGIKIHPGKAAIQRKLDCGESGLGIRLTTSIASTFGGDFEIIGHGSLTERPMSDFETFLPALQVKFKSDNGYLPLTISGKIQGGEVTLDGSMSSQFLSGILMALPLADSDSVITVTNLNSKPYVAMTLSLMSAFGISVKNDRYQTFSIKGNQTYKSPETYKVESDWSGAAFWIVYGCIANPIMITGLNQKSSQADRAIMLVLEMTGANFQWQNDNLIIQPNNLKPFNFNATDCPDLFPILATLAASIYGTSKIEGIGRLTHKESNRSKAIQEEFSKLGLSIELQEDTMIINGKGKLKSGAVSSRNDHRMAMSLAIAATLTEAGIVISEAESVNKSYPEFWNICPHQKIISE